MATELGIRMKEKNFNFVKVSSRIFNLISNFNEKFDFVKLQYNTVARLVFYLISQLPKYLQRSQNM